MSPGLTMERVYDTLRQQIVSAALAPGTRLDPARLAHELNASATPVRDALHRLLGERLVDARAQEGFHVPVHSEASLRDLHAWSLDLLLAATRPAIPPLFAAEPAEPASDSDIAGLFETIAASSGNFEHRIAMHNLNARLHPARLVEVRIITDHDAERARLSEAWQAGHSVEIKRRLVAFHRRRIKLVPQIAAAMREQHSL